MTRPAEIFVSYAHADEKFRQDLSRALAPQVKWSEQIALWHDGMISVGENWDDSIRTALARADLVIFLISPHLINSDYVRRVEAAETWDRLAEGGGVVLPVLMRDVDLSDTPFNKLQWVPRGKPIASRRDRDTAWKEVAEAIRAKVEQLHIPDGTDTDTAKLDTIRSTSSTVTVPAPGNEWAEPARWLNTVAFLLRQIPTGPQAEALVAYIDDLWSIVDLAKVLKPAERRAIEDIARTAATAVHSYCENERMGYESPSNAAGRRRLIEDRKRYFDDMYQAVGDLRDVVDQLAAASSP